MHADDLFVQAFIYLAAAVLVVPISNRLGLGSVLGYLIAGVLIGPFGLHLVGRNGDDVMHFAEFGVVMMLFLVGLELQPALLWRLRTPILGLGGLQVLVTALVIALLALLLGQTPSVALAVVTILPARRPKCPWRISSLPSRNPCGPHAATCLLPRAAPASMAAA
jgi:Kef-type K+ transport system membrane component KefB